MSTFQVYAGCGSGFEYIQVYPARASFPAVGQTNVLYHDNATGDKWSWDGSAYVILGGGGGGTGTVTSVGVSSTTAGVTIGDSPVTSAGVITINIATASETNPGLLTAAKYVEFDAKQDELVSGTNIKSVNGITLLGAGDLEVGTVTEVGLTSATPGVTITGSPVTTDGDLNIEIGTADVDNPGLLSSEDWNTFNDKQDELVSGTNIKTINGNSLLGAGDLIVGGASGTENYVAKFIDADNLGDSQIFDDGTFVGINTTTPGTFRLDVNGTARTGTLTINTNGQSRIISTYTGNNAAGFNIFIGTGGTFSNADGGTSTNGSRNTALGVGALYSLTNGFGNVGLGMNALYYNDTGYGNVGVGGNALAFNVGGTQNVAMGPNAMYRNVSGAQNTGIGPLALFENTTGTNNVAVGYRAGEFINSGEKNQTSGNCVLVGTFTRLLADGDTNEIVIGYEGRGNGSNTVTIGNLNTTDNYFFGAIRTSDPVGGTAAPWRLGSAANVSPTAPNATIEVSINGTTYYIHAKTTND